MNGCRYCVIMHHRKRRGRKRARGVAMCLAQDEMTRCEQRSDERGPGCSFHDAKLLENDAAGAAPTPTPVYAKVRTEKHPTAPPMHLKAHALP